MSEEQQILLVDDDARFCSLLGRALNRSGFRTAQCADGAEALQRAEANGGAGLMVLDYDLPGMNGAQTCARLRAHAHPEVSQMPVILLTGFAGHEVECLHAGADDFVEKPVNPTVLQARIETHLRVAALRQQLQEKNRLLEAWQTRYQQDLEAARVVQQAILPRRFPDLPGWRFAAHYAPLWPVGGDLYDWVPLSGDRVLFWLTDATGHGASAALLTAFAKLLFRHAAVECGCRGPEAMLEEVNRECCALLEGQSIMTAACVELGAGQITVAGAGHPPVLLFREREKRVEPLYSGAPPLGFCGEEWGGGEVTAALAPGDGFLLFSDGLYGFRNAVGERTGFPSLLHALRQGSADSATGWLEKVRRDAARLSGGGALEDDISIVVGRYDPEARTEEED